MKRALRLSDVWPCACAILVAGCGSDEPGSRRPRASNATNIQVAAPLVMPAETDVVAIPAPEPEAVLPAAKDPDDAPSADQTAQPTRSKEETSVKGDGRAASLIEREVARRGELVFESTRAPRPEGSDGLSLTLLPDGKARVVYFGVEDETEPVDGNYRVDLDGLLWLDFGAEDPWLPMPITNESDTLRVNAPAKEAIIRMAVESGFERDEITEADLNAAFDAWPLRRLAPTAADRSD